MFLGYRRARREQAAELNVTPFMNLMVALVPFLLVTAVFTQMAVLELSLPEAAEAPATPPKPPLTVVVRTTGLTVIEPGGSRHVLPARAEGHDLQALSALLLQLKQRRPGDDRISLLLEPDTPYDILIQVMDTVRVQPGTGAPLDLFPAIALGDAPADAAR